jgi:hypothetical protein
MNEATDKKHDTKPNDNVTTIRVLNLKSGSDDEKGPPLRIALEFCKFFDCSLCLKTLRSSDTQK